MRRIGLVLAFLLGCAAAIRPGAHWQTYCCADGSIDDPRGCRASAPAGADACVESGAWAMECRDTRAGECAGGGIDCFCCREVGDQGCTMRLRSARLDPPPLEEPPEAPAVQHRRPGRVWSPF
jgi:hypothetical protein